MRPYCLARCTYFRTWTRPPRELTGASAARRRSFASFTGVLLPEGDGLVIVRSDLRQQVAAGCGLSLSQAPAFCQLRCDLAGADPSAISGPYAAFGCAEKGPKISARCAADRGYGNVPQDRLRQLGKAKRRLSRLPWPSVSAVERIVKIFLLGLDEAQDIQPDHHRRASTLSQRCPGFAEPGVTRCRWDLPGQWQLHTVGFGAGRAIGSLEDPEIIRYPWKRFLANFRRRLAQFARSSALNQ